MKKTNTPIPFSSTKKAIADFINSLYTERIIEVADIKNKKHALEVLQRFTIQIDREQDKLLTIEWLTAHFNTLELRKAGFFIDCVVKPTQILSHKWVYLFGQTNFCQHHDEKSFTKYRVFDNSQLDLQVSDAATVSVEAFDHSNVTIECSHISSAIVFTGNDSKCHIILNDKSEAFFQ
jgi:hypothetical protein